MIEDFRYGNALKAHCEKKLKEAKPNIFICGHSHILIAQGCPEFGGLHLNPGAAGLYGNHAVRTLMRFNLTSKGVKNLEVIEIKRKSVYL